MSQEMRSNIPPLGSIKNRVGVFFGEDHYQKGVMKIHPKWDKNRLISGRAVGFLSPNQNSCHARIFGKGEQFASVEEAKSSVKPEYEAFWIEEESRVFFTIRTTHRDLKIGTIICRERRYDSYAIDAYTGLHFIVNTHSDLESAKEFLKQHLGAS